MALKSPELSEIEEFLQKIILLLLGVKDFDIELWLGLMFGLRSGESRWSRGELKTGFNSASLLSSSSEEETCEELSLESSPPLLTFWALNRFCSSSLGFSRRMKNF